MDRRTLLDAEAQRQREEQWAEKQQAEKREKMLSDFMSMDNLSDDELAKLKQEAPLLYLLASTGVGSSLGRFFSQVPSAQEAIVTGQGLTLSVGALPPAAQQSLLDMLRATCKLGKMITGKEETLPPALGEVYSGRPRIGPSVEEHNTGKHTRACTGICIGNRGDDPEDPAGETPGRPVASRENQDACR